MKYKIVKLVTGNLLIILVDYDDEDDDKFICD